MNANPAKLLFSLGISLIFIALGCHLIQDEDSLSRTIGYANVIFWSLLWIFVGIKLLYDYLKRTKNNA